MRPLIQSTTGHLSLLSIELHLALWLHVAFTYQLVISDEQLSWTSAEIPRQPSIEQLNFRVLLGNDNTMPLCQEGDQDMMEKARTGADTENWLPLTRKLLIFIHVNLSNNVKS